jgi:CHAT domain-containing protein
MEPGGGLLPGLVLGRSADGPGHLDVEDVSHLDLNADLVVLSACESGRGPVYNGEGVRGLTASFLAAGSRAVLCTLWKVDDAAAARFVTSFHAKVKAGMPPARALREVRRAAIAAGKLPADWAAFVLVGG